MVINGENRNKIQCLYTKNGELSIRNCFFMLLNMLILYYLNGHYLFSFFNAFSKEERTREDLIFNRLGENEFVDEDETF